MSYKLLLLIALFMPILLVAAGRWTHVVERSNFRLEPGPYRGRRGDFPPSAAAPEYSMRDAGSLEIRIPSLCQ